MLRFFKDAVREMRHVVWPTQKQTRNFFMLVLGLLTFFTLYLFLFSNVFSTITFGLQDLFGGSANNQSIPTSVETTLPDMNVDTFLNSDELQETIISDEVMIDEDISVSISATGADLSNDQ